VINRRLRHSQGSDAIDAARTGYSGSVVVDEFLVLLASSNSPLVQASTART
jgi:hypothetical protein